VQPISEPLVRQVLAGFVATPIVGKAKPKALPVEMQLVITDEGPRLRTRVSRRSDQFHWIYAAPKRPYAEFFNERRLFAAGAAWKQANAGGIGCDSDQPAGGAAVSILAAAFRHARLAHCRSSRDLHVINGGEERCEREKEWQP
jgi:hypothetical protein